jgi:hypothetical protein
VAPDDLVLVETAYAMSVCLISSLQFDPQCSSSNSSILACQDVVVVVKQS